MEEENLKEELESEEDYISGQEYRERIQKMESKKLVKTTWKQKLAVVFLAIFAVSALVLWAAQFKGNLAINKPLTADQLSTNKVTESDIKNIDTDEDGLSDYDELYYYNTSPYLEDSDSDGVEDKAEIELGEDPNCPQGQNCFIMAEANEENKTVPIDNGSLPAGQDFQPLDAETDIEREKMENVLSGDTQANELRALLKQVGMSEDMLNKISDEELMNAYSDILQGENSK